jgi:hypothetical protein
MHVISIIIRILQHFATKLWNITNFVMLFQAVMKLLSRLVEIKILSVTQVVNLPDFYNDYFKQNNELHNYNTRNILPSYT